MIPFDKEGYIVDGIMKGFYIKIIFDKEETGGYYVFYSKNFKDKTAEGYDEWYLDIKVIESLLNEIDVEWKD